MNERGVAVSAVTRLTDIPQQDLDQLQRLLVFRLASPPL